MFKNGLILKGECYVPEHNDFYIMMEKFGAKARDEGIVRMSLVSPDNSWENIANWKCVVYTCNCPEWFRKNQKQYEASFREAVWNYVLRHTKIGVEINELSEDIYFLTQCKVKKVSGNVNLWLKDSSIMQLQDDVVVKSMSGESSIQCMSGNVVIEQMSGNSWVQRMQDSARIQRMHGSAVVQHMMDDSSIYRMSGRAMVQAMRGCSTVSLLSGSTVIQTMKENAAVFSMCENAMVQSMDGNTIIHKMRGMTLVQSMYGNSRIQKIGNGSKVAFMRGNSTAIRKNGMVWEAPKNARILR